MDQTPPIIALDFLIKTIWSKLIYITIYFYHNIMKYTFPASNLFKFIYKNLPKVITIFVLFPKGQGIKETNLYFIFSYYIVCLFATSIIIKE